MKTNSYVERRALALTLGCALFWIGLGGCESGCPTGWMVQSSRCVRVVGPMGDDASMPIEAENAVTVAGNSGGSGGKTAKGATAGATAGKGGGGRESTAGTKGSNESTAGMSSGGKDAEGDEGGAGGASGEVAEGGAGTSGAGGASGQTGVSGAGASGTSAGASGAEAGMSGGSAVCTSECCSDETCPKGAKCEQGKCHCPEAYHVCSEACVDSKATATCGTSCQACPAPSGGSASCDGSECSANCPTNTRLCAGACIGESKPCDNVCPQGKHNCSNNCVADNSVTACGASCAPCKTPTHAKATCDGNACGFTCDASYRTCEAGCIEAQGACCTSSDCSSSNHEVCEVGSHRCQCADNYKDCNGQCIPKGACCASSECGSAQTCNQSSHSCQCDANSKDCNGSCISKTACCAGTDTGNSCRSGSVSGVCNNAARCVECLGESDCQARGKHCDTTRNVCAACRNASDCPGGSFARCDSGMCSIAVGCGNGIVDGDDECEVGGVGAPGTAKWTSGTCTSDCKSLIYLTFTSVAAAGCTAPRVTNEIVQCTLPCSTAADCPALGKGYPKAECGITGMKTCQIRCSGQNDCLPSGGSFCLALMGLPSMPNVCANPGF